MQIDFKYCTCIKKNDKLRVCVDFINLNLVTSKDEYSMPMVDMLVNLVIDNKILIFMDCHSCRL
jgi:hypothetical protein